MGRAEHAPVAARLPRERLLLHLNADALQVKLGQPVHTWPDLSGGGNDAIQPVRRKRPRLRRIVKAAKAKAARRIA